MLHMSFSLRLELSFEFKTKQETNQKKKKKITDAGHPDSAAPCRCVCLQRIGRLPVNSTGGDLANLPPAVRRWCSAHLFMVAPSLLLLILQASSEFVVPPSCWPPKLSGFFFCSLRNHIGKFVTKSSLDREERKGKS